MRFAELSEMIATDSVGIVINYRLWAVTYNENKMSAFEIVLKKYDVEVGRIRQNLIFGDHGLEFFVAGDQILKGAALNAIQIGEIVVKQRFN